MIVKICKYCNLYLGLYIVNGKACCDECFELLQTSQEQQNELK